VLSAAAILSLAGCKVGPDYKPAQPNAALPEAFTHTGGEGFAPTSITTPGKPPQVEWWKVLNDQKLDDLVTRAWNGNLDLRLATARIREARAQRGVVAADGLPQVDVDGEVSRQRNSKNTFGTFNNGSAFNTYTAGFDASWELDFFGRVARNVEAAEADIQSAEEDRRSVLVTLVSEVARNYLELRGFQQRLAIARKNIEVQRSTLDLTRNRFKAGLVSDLDVAQAESSLSATESAVPPLDAAVHASIHRIGVLLGRQPTELTAELSPIAEIPVPPAEIPVGLPSELLQRRPDIRKAERDVAAATARIGVATADLYPRFSLTGSFGFSADKVADIGDASSRFWSFGPAVRWPILDWGRIRANIKVEDARTEQSLVRYEQAVLGSFEDVENALVNYSREQARVRSLASSVASDQRAFDVANKLYSSGVTDFQRVLDSQRSLVLSEDALVQSQKNVSTNLVALYKALGGGWESFTPDHEPAKYHLHPSSHFWDGEEASEPAQSPADAAEGERASK
jgi:NodT family efflux transporter outer membrane factor (OMF) lipoprotein